MHENSKNSFFTVGLRSGRVPAQGHSDREIGRLSSTRATAVLLVQYYSTGTTVLQCYSCTAVTAVAVQL